MDYNFVEVMEHFDRMCTKYNNDCYNSDCPISKLISEWEDNNDTNWEEACAYFGAKHPYEFARAVMEWADTHSELQYGTIRDIVKEMLEMMGIFEDTLTSYALDTKINKEIAERFNIKPINYPASN